jgi:broad specificity phosphatase PhoE
VTATFLLIRHAAHLELGKTLTGRKSDVALSRDGLDQARIVADLLGVEPIDAVYASPRERAFYTAREIAEPHELTVEILDGLDEIDFGDGRQRFDELEGDPLWDVERGAEQRPGPRRRDMAEATGGLALAELPASHADQRIASSALRHHPRPIASIGCLSTICSLRYRPRLRIRLAVGSWGARV